MAEPVRIIGSYLSPYVRKVLVCLHAKGLDYRIDPIVPFFGNEEFSRLSPLRRIPVLIDEQVTLSDSSVICQYLEDCHPEPPLFPRDVAERARARWLEEYADTRIGEVFIWRLFDQRVIKPYVWGEPTDEEALARTLREDVPDVLDYLESQLPPQGFLFGEPCIADIGIAAFFRNAGFAGLRVDAARWPRTASFVDRAFDLPGFARLRPFEDLSLRTPLPKQREALAAAGAPLTEETLATPRARRGVLQT